MGPRNGPRRLAAGLLAAGVGLAGAGWAGADDAPRVPPADGRAADAVRRLEEAIEKLKDQPEARAQLRRTLDQMRRAMAAAGERPGRPAPFSGFPDFRPTGTRLGVGLTPVPEPLADQLDLAPGAGALIRDVFPGSPADKAGLKRNDVLVKYDGKDVTAEENVHALIAAKAGEKADVVVLRKGKKETVTVELPAPARPERRPEERPRDGGRRVAFESLATTLVNGKFEIKAEAGAVKYAVAGKLDEGRPVPAKITVTADGKESSYDTLDAVPEAHAPAVRQLLAGVGGR